MDQPNTPFVKQRLAELTGGEMRQAAARRPVILLPLGSHEDQGPHAPMGDYLSAEGVALRIAATATDAGTETLVAPTLPFGGADYFASMPGGIALSQSTLRAVLDDVLACLLRHDLTRIVVINGHAGNVQAIHDATQKVWLQRGCVIPSLYLWRVAYGMLPAILGADVARRASGHGADPLTSVAMHLFPDLIRRDLIPAAAPPPDFRGMPVSGFGTVDFEGVEVAVPLEVAQIAPNGVWQGDPRLCSPETGAALVDRLAAIGARLATRVAGWDA
ncbi:creatininase family protein [Rhodopila sp.]|uniref:creatininase family protein n=1 Tax=Rhodopila sp. TaxID=2480087 RepID=UPI003D0BF858